MRTNHRFLVVRYCITVAFFTPFFLVWNIGDTLSSRCSILLSCGISRRFLYNRISPFWRMCVSLLYPLGSVEYSQYCMQKNNVPAIIWKMDVFRWVFFACRFKTLAYLVYIFGVLLVYPDTCSPWVFSSVLRMFDLRNIGLVSSRGASVRTQIHPIWRIWQFHGGLFVYLLCQTDLFELMRLMMKPWLFMFLWDPPQ